MVTLGFNFPTLKLYNRTQAGLKNKKPVCIENYRKTLTRL